jgi:probable blue pigment (indigoidine) exporter
VPGAPRVSRTDERAGLLFAALCAVNAAFVPAAAKLTTDRADPMFVAAATTLFAGATALAVLATRRQLRLLVHAHIGPRLLLVGVLGTAAAFWLFFAGARRATAIETALCLQIEPAYSLVGAWLVLGQRPTVRRVAAISLLLVGIALALGGNAWSAPSPGVWALLATPLCWQLSHVVVLSGLAGVPPTVLTGARYVYGGLALTAVWVLSGTPTAIAAGTSPATLVAALAVQGIVLSYLGTMLWYEAIIRLDLARTTAIVVPSTPLLSLAVTATLVGERPTPVQLAGVLLTAAGVLGFVTAPHAAPVRVRIPIWTAPLTGASRTDRHDA